jgi:SAM-dependent methyltransferase
VFEHVTLFLAHLGHRRGNRGPRATSAEFLLRASRIAKDIRNGDAVLDVGCGVGRTLADIAKFREIRPFGVDLSLDRYVFDEIPAAEFDGRSLPFEEARFDVTICCYVFHHLSREDASALLREMIRVTRRTIILLEDSMPKFNWLYRLRNRFHRINAAAMYSGESKSYLTPANEAMFLTHDQWRKFASEIPDVSSVAIDSLQDVTRRRHHTLISLTVGAPHAGSEESKPKANRETADVTTDAVAVQRTLSLALGTAQARPGANGA